MSADFDAIARPHLNALLEPGEQQMKRRGAKGEPVSIRPEELVDAHVDGAGAGWWTPPAATLDAVAVTLTLRTADKLKMMRAEGPLGRASGGEGQREGILALADWMRRRESLSG